MKNYRKVGITAVVLFLICFLYLLFGPPVFNLSQKDREKIKQVVSEKTDSKYLRISVHSHFRVKVEAEETYNSDNGGEFYYLWRTPFGWKISDSGFYIY